MLGFAKVAAAGLAATTLWGGWAIVTVKDVPAYYVAGQEYTIEFQVRQHGRTLLSGLEPRLVLSTSERRLGGLMGGKDERVIPAVARGGAGAYAVTFTAPESDQLFLTIKSGWGTSEARLPAERVVRQGAAAPVIAAAERGEILFVAKGCNVCHQENSVGPALTGRQLARSYVVQKIKNPASQVMPDLGLSDAEANAIAAFLSGERTAASGGR